MLGRMKNCNGPADAFPSDPRLRLWLQAEGSLTSRLRAHGQVRVRVQQQGAAALWVPEQADLGQRFGYVREVVLLLDGRPAVWARSATSLRASKGPWRAMRGLGTRPLAELLFAARHVERDRLRALQLPKGGRMQRYLSAQWQGLAQPEPLGTPHSAVPRWARSSVFWLHCHPLRVMEAFSPWVSTL
jgi:chorismate--pyruvate lyase